MKTYKLQINFFDGNFVVRRVKSYDEESAQKEAFHMLFDEVEQEKIHSMEII